MAQGLEVVLRLLHRHDVEPRDDLGEGEQGVQIARLGASRSVDSQFSVRPPKARTLQVAISRLRSSALDPLFANNPLCSISPCCGCEIQTTS